MLTQPCSKKFFGGSLHTELCLVTGQARGIRETQRRRTYSLQGKIKKIWEVGKGQVGRI